LTNLRSRAAEQQGPPRLRGFGFLPKLALGALIASLALLLAGCSASDYMRTASPMPGPDPNESKVIVYQLDQFRTGPFPFYEVVDGTPKLLGFSENRRYFEFRCSPGVHRFCTWGDGDSWIDGDLAGGMTYVIRAFSEPHIFGIRLGFAPVKPGSAEMAKFDKLRPSMRCVELDPETASEYLPRYLPVDAEGRRKAEAAMLEAKKNPQNLRPRDGRKGDEPPSK